MAGVILTFDMHPQQETAAEWQANIFPPSNSSLLEVLARHNVKATFMVDHFDLVAQNWDWIVLLRDIHNQGHEIGCHTLTHAKWGAPKFPDNPESPLWNNPWNYFSEQVYRNIQWYRYIRSAFAQNWPEKPRSFAYPYDVSGAAIDPVLLGFFKHLRGHPEGNPGVFGPLTEAEVQSTGTINGGWLDNLAISQGWWTTYSTQWLPPVFNQNKMVFFSAHIPNWSGSDYSSNPWVLDYMLGYINQRAPGVFMKMGDVPSNFGTSMALEDVDIAEHMFPDTIPTEMNLEIKK